MNIVLEKVGHIFFHDRQMPYGSPCNTPSYSGKQLIGILFMLLCTNVEVNNLPATTFHPRIYDQVERCNKTLVSWLQLYITDDEHNWEMSMQSRTYKYSCQVYRSPNDTLSAWHCPETHQK